VDSRNGVAVALCSDGLTVNRPYCWQAYNKARWHADQQDLNRTQKQSSLYSLPTQHRLPLRLGEVAQRGDEVARKVSGRRNPIGLLALLLTGGCAGSPENRSCSALTSTETELPEHELARCILHLNLGKTLHDTTLDRDLQFPGNGRVVLAARANY
jgi:hypothetical protein